MQHYYKILGLQAGASVAEIKRAYRVLAKRYHPDVNNSPEAREQFMRITEAYDYLLNPPKAKYTHSTNWQDVENERIRHAKAAAARAARMRYQALKNKREQEQSRAYSRGISVFMGIVFFALAVTYGKPFFNELYVDQNAATTTARLVSFSYRHYFLVYRVDGKTYSKKYSGRRTKKDLVTPNGMPVYVGCEFLVKYRNDNPEYCYLDFDEILPQTLRVYQRAVHYPLCNYFDVEMYDQRINCFSAAIYNEFGLGGLADIYFQQEPLIENFNHNKGSFKKLAASNAFNQLAKSCGLPH